jgi:hypothetical protein
MTTGMATMASQDETRGKTRTRHEQKRPFLKPFAKALESRPKSFWRRFAILAFVVFFRKTAATSHFIFLLSYSYPYGYIGI